MVGRDVLLRVDKAASKAGDVLLHVEDLDVLDERGLEAVRGVSLDVRAGEIVAIAGVDGNGQTQLIDAITGLTKPDVGQHRRRRRGACRRRARTRSSTHGVGHIPEDRHRRGLVLEFSLAENLVLHDYAKEPNASSGLLHPKPITDSARRLLKEFDVRGGAPETRGVRALGRQPAEGRRRA